jgi:hypothetical protein
MKDMNDQIRPEPTNRGSKTIARLRMTLCALGCLFVFAAFFITFARLDDMHVGEVERVAIFTWTDLRLRVYLGGALCSFVAAIVLSAWPRSKPDSNRP